MDLLKIIPSYCPGLSSKAHIMKNSCFNQRDVASANDANASLHRSSHGLPGRSSLLGHVSLAKPASEDVLSDSRGMVLETG